jgi:hypothetical protein
MRGADERLIFGFCESLYFQKMVYGQRACAPSEQGQQQTDPA